MSWGELNSDIAGLGSNTPLGNIIRIRKETDPEILKRFTPEEKKIRNEWLRKSASQVSPESYDKAINNIKNMFLSMARKENN